MLFSSLLFFFAGWVNRIGANIAIEASIFVRNLCRYEKKYYLCIRINAQMAESVDALVSNTSGAIRPGSTPGLGTKQQG